MRAIFFSNFFPPHARGGYEQWCAEVAVELRRRGHTMHVATAAEPGEVRTDYHGVSVHRILNLEVQAGKWETASRFFLRRNYLEHNTLSRVESLISTVKPDVILNWGMWNVPRSIPALTERLLLEKVAYYFCDYWTTLPSAYEQYWSTPSADAWPVQIAKRLAGKIALSQIGHAPSHTLNFQNCYCVSEFVCRQLTACGVNLGHSEVVHGGTEVEQFATAKVDCRDRRRDEPLRLLYAGRINREKGVHTILNALCKIPRGSVFLSIYGNHNSVFGDYLKEVVTENDLSCYVNFAGSVARSDMPAVMAQHDLLVFSSIWDEPFARTVIEGMASGLVVVGTTTGGTGEILLDNETGLTFPAGDADVLARQIERLIHDPALIDRLSAAGSEQVRTNFRFDQMVDLLESELAVL